MAQMDRARRGDHDSIFFYSFRTQYTSTFNQPFFHIFLNMFMHKTLRYDIYDGIN